MRRFDHQEARVIVVRGPVAPQPPASPATRKSGTGFPSATALPVIATVTDMIVRSGAMLQQLPPAGSPGAGRSLRGHRAGADP